VASWWQLIPQVGFLAADAERVTGISPQGFSHIGLINTAFNLVKAQGAVQQRSQRAAPSNEKGRQRTDAKSEKRRQRK